MSRTDEKKGLYISIFGSFLFGILGMTFAIITGSQAVLLDGAFNLIGALMGIVGLRIAIRWEDQRRSIIPSDSMPWSLCLSLVKD